MFLILICEITLEFNEVERGFILESCISIYLYIIKNVNMYERLKEI